MSQVARFLIGLGGIILAVLLGGGLGGAAGRAAGVYAPTFVREIAPAPIGGLPPGFDVVEFGTGLGIVSGLFFGAAAGAFLIALIVVRELWLATLAARRPRPEVADPALLSRRSSASAGPA